MVREQFVPVSIEIHYASKRPDLEGKFIRERLKRPSYNGWIAATPNGVILNDEPYLDIVLHRGLEKWNQLPAEERKPGLKLEDLGPVDPACDLAPPPGGLVLKAYIRSLVRDAGGELRAPLKVDLDNAGAAPIDAQAQRDHLWLTHAEAAALLPAGAVAGSRHPAPAFLVERICRFHLKDSATCIPGTSAASFGKYSGKMTFVVTEAASSKVRLRVEGAARGDGPEFQFLGVLEIEPAKKVVQRFDLVAFSETGHIDKKTRAASPLGIAFERAIGDRPMDRVPPYFFTVEHWRDAPKAREEAYFGSSK